MAREIMLLCFGLGACWDGLTTAIGIAAIIKADAFWQYLWCLVGGLVILGFGVGTRNIFASDVMPFPILKRLWWLAFGFDVLTSFFGNVVYIVLRSEPPSLAAAVWSLTLLQLLLAVGLTVLVSSAPIMLSYVFEPEPARRAAAG